MRTLYFICALLFFVAFIFYIDPEMGDDTPKAMMYQTLCIIYYINYRDDANKN